MNWRDSFYRSPGTSWDWVGFCPGRTGDTVSAQWPLYKRALIDAGVTDDDVPTHSAINTYPMEDGRFVNLVGKNLQAGTASFISTGGDTQGGTIREMKAGESVGDQALGGPFGANNGTQSYDFGHSVTSAMVACFRTQSWPEPDTSDACLAEQVLAPVSNDSSERVVIKAGAENWLGKCRGRLTTTGKVTIKPLREYVTFFGNDSVRRSIWEGKDVEFSFDVKRSIVLDARCRLYARWLFIAENDGTWEYLR